MNEKTKKILKIVLIGIVLILVSLLPSLNLKYKEYKMNQMLMEHGIMSSDGELLPPYSGE